eukprot:530638-Hanusia_phi.AAC.1
MVRHRPRLRRRLQAPPAAHHGARRPVRCAHIGGQRAAVRQVRAGLQHEHELGGGEYHAGVSDLEQHHERVQAEGAGHRGALYLPYAGHQHLLGSRRLGLALGHRMVREGRTELSPCWASGAVGEADQGQGAGGAQPAPSSAGQGAAARHRGLAGGAAAGAATGEDATHERVLRDDGEGSG